MSLEPPSTPEIHPLPPDLPRSRRAPRIAIREKPEAAAPENSSERSSVAFFPWMVVFLWLVALLLVFGAQYLIEVLVQ